MKSPQYKMLLWYIAGLLMMGISAYGVSLLFDVVPHLADLHWLVRLIPALVFMLGAVAAHLLSRKRVKWAYVLSYFLNAIGSGWIIGVVIGVKEILLTQELFLSLLPAMFLGILYCCLIGNVSTNRASTITGVFVALSVVLLLGGIAVWIWVYSLTGCVFLFSALFLLPFPIGANIALDTPDDTYRYLSFTGFGAFLLISFVALIILSEGEGLDGIDLDLGGGGGKKRKK